MNEKFAFFLPSLAGGGAERVIINLCEQLSYEGIAIDLLVSSASGEYLSDLPTSINLIDLGHEKPLHAIPKLISYIRKSRPTAILATITNANIAALIATVLAATKTRCIVREASTLSIEINKSTPFNQIVLPLLVRLLYSRAKCVVAPSNGVARDLSELAKIPLEKISVIPNPIVSPSMLNRAKAPADHPWLFEGSHHDVIIGMGRLTAQKDFTTLIKAFKIVRRNRKAKLIIIGEGEQRSELEELIKKKSLEEDVSMPGFIKNPYSYLSRASVFVLSSIWEGLPGVLIEALACGAKVVATDCQSGPREILANGRYGQLVPVGDWQFMANAIEQVLACDYVTGNPCEAIKMYQLDRNTNIYKNILLGSLG